MLQNLCFPLQINFSINVGCIDRDMAQPSANGVDIDSGAKGVGGRRMPDGVGAD